MEITNAKIKDVTIAFEERNWLCAKMKFKGYGTACNWRFTLTNPIDVERLIKLMQYTETWNISELDGKIIRVVIINNCLRGFGHPIEDKFVPILTDDCNEIPVEFLKEIIKKSK